MRPFDIIATDLDGTFLTDDKRVLEANARAIRTASRQGIATVFATGRPARWLGPLRELSDVHPWAIASNGAVTMELETGRVLHARPLSPDVASRVGEEVREALPEALFAVEYASQWAAETGYPPRGDEDPAHRGTLESLLDHDAVVKLLVLGPTTPTEDLADLVAPIVGDRLTVTFSYVAEAGMLELSAPGVSKALALTELLTDLGIEPGRMVAFGDMPNDLAMLELAGRGFAMSAAHDSLRRAGYEIAGDNNDAAVGRTILRLLDGASPRV
ncbi:Cof-type HAD-IIB family hydrolase [Brooklawnia cerclae]|uniref:Hydrolase n=1 Tax=Brooklawnia cerclae TaxID=349934 RepID=A0ABX0SCT5_9ACTN|nr:HAD family hydrolase [Brooklawnia cerclae]NIH56195.1 hypothetical protein [Brooklawnia cerclae]